MTTEQIPCLKINCPELFADPEFAAWVLSGSLSQSGNKLATWHSGPDMHEFSDVFVTYDHGDGSDADYIPEHCWAKLCETAKAAGVEYAVLWLTNLEC